MTPSLESRLQAVAVGAALGDALGMPLEFGPARAESNLLREMIAGRLPAGSFTDDTEMALALADSLAQKRPLNPEDLARRFTGWFKQNPPDVGFQTASVLSQISGGMPWEEAARRSRREAPDSAGNGSVMRCWPAAVAFWNDRRQMISASELQSLITHPHPECVAGCVFINLLIWELLRGVSAEEALRAATSHATLPHELSETIQAAPLKKRAALKNSGWVRHTVESVVWGLCNTDSFEEAVVQVANLGNDADTAASVMGAVAGARYGLEAIPQPWLDALQGEWPLGSGIVWRTADFCRLAVKLAGI